MVVGTLVPATICLIPGQRKTMKKIAKKPLSATGLAATLSLARAGCNVAQNSNLADQGIASRDPPFGKGNAGNDTMHQPAGNAAAQASTPSEIIPPRDPPFAKGM